MRLSAVSGLLALYQQPDNISPLHEFTARFCNRFLELVYDVDETVAVRAVRFTLIAALVSSGPVLHGSKEVSNNHVEANKRQSFPSNCTCKILSNCDQRQ